MRHIRTVTDLRRLAMECATVASAAMDAANRDRFLKMRDGLLALAGNEDWLNGQDVRLESDVDIIALAERIGRDSKTV
jgi:hypothetical protein